ncbi:hypothetical protein [Niveibacterium umoris]|uniref:Uncharacterized protein n=1 Tax=Niveibacterium umoris TaxID=1193620 RepID=A0A840BPF5_9RHOO|nr:hypothetical protein [Niveibacterium umoris]MBB4013408.1 hypothetical protein [Niveibacterium umoris]
MPDAQRTAWFPAATDPAREGWYEVLTEDGEHCMARWARLNGETGWWASRRIFGIEVPRSMPDVLQWRGLVAPHTDGH